MPKLYVLAEKKDEIRKELLAGLKGVEIIYGDSIPYVELFTADAIACYINNEQWGIDEIPEIRSQLELFLKPIYAISERRIEKLAGIIDDTILFTSSPVTVAQKIQIGLHIAQKVELYQKSFPKENIKEILLLRYLETREYDRLTPVRDFSSRLGYNYPLVATLLNLPDGDARELLENLADVSMLSRVLLDKVNLCPFCEHVQVNIREICPKCRALSIQEDEILHQYVCSDCGSQFTNPQLDCLCLSCGKVFTRETALTKTIYEYKITADGTYAAKQGILPTASLMKIIRKETGFYSLETFKNMLQKEVRRCLRYKYNSTLVLFSIKNIQQIIDLIGLAQAQKVWKDIAAVFNESFRDTDILTEYRVDEHLVILSHTDVNGAQAMIERIKTRINLLVKQPINLNYHIIELQDEKIELEALLSKMK